MDAVGSPSPFTQVRGLEALGDRELLRLSGTLGRDRKVADRQFLATLVEIDRRGILATRKAYGSIQEYGSRVGGVSAQTVTDVLNLGGTYADYPLSWRLFASGRVGWTLLRTLAPVLGLRSDREWSAILAVGTKHGLELLVKGMRRPADPDPRPPGPGEVLPGKDLPPRSAARGSPLEQSTAIDPGALTVEASGAPARPWSDDPSPDVVAAPRSQAPTGPASLPLDAALLARLEVRRRQLAERLGRDVDLPGLVAALLDATEARPAAGPAVPAAILPGKRPAGFVEVVVRDAGSGRLLHRTSAGWEDAPAGLGLQILCEGTEILEASALEAASACHGALHAGLLDDPGRWLAPGLVPRLGWVDRAVVARRAASWNAGPEARSPSGRTARAGSDPG